MESNNFSRFVRKVLETELIFKYLSQHDQEQALKVILSLCRKCEQIVGHARTGSLTSTQSDAEKLLEGHYTSDLVVKSLLCDIVSKAITASEEKGRVWPSTRLRERKATLKTVASISHSDDEYGAAEETDDYEYDADRKTNSMLQRKRKQKFPKRSQLQMQGDQAGTTTPKRRGRKQSTNKSKVQKTVPVTKPAPSTPVTSNSESKVSTKENMQLFKIKKKRGRPPKRKIFTCEKCDKTFTHAHSLTVHAMEHGVAPGSCHLCEKQFVSVEDVMLHRCAKKTDKKRIPKLCRVCGDEFTTSKLLQGHMQSEHGILQKLPKHHCKYCEKGFIKKITMFRHYKMHAEGKLVCMRCGEFCVNEETYNSHMLDHDKDAKFTCTKCGANFHHAQHYDQHMQAHERHECPKCKRQHISRKELLKHHREEHGENIPLEEKTHECEICAKKFFRPSVLTIHRRIHTGEKPVECTACKLFFRTTKALFKHKQTYSHSVRAGEGEKERGFLCNVCGKAYFRKHALKRHMQYHTGDKPHMCQYCGYKCREANNLKRHMSLHFESERNFVCEICGSAFHAKKTLEMHHAYKHSDNREFGCDQCNLTFKAKNALKRHMKVHSTEKEHKCWCGTAFKRMYNLRRHLKAVHGADDLLPPVRRVHTLDSNSKAPSSRTDGKNNEFPLSQEEIEIIVKNAHHKPESSLEQSSTQQTPVETPTPQEVAEGMKFVPHGIMSPHDQGEETLEQQTHHQPTPATSPQQTLPISVTQDTQIQHSQEVPIRMRFNTETGVYNLPHPTGIDLSDPYLQSNPQLGSGNFIPQAVAYSTIMREYGQQFPFIQDPSNYHGFVK